MTLKRLIKRIGPTGYLFAMPWLVGFFVFVLGPVVVSLYLSFTYYDIMNAPKWIGLGNYSKMLFEDRRFWTSLYNTAYYVVFSVPLQIILGIAIAMLMNEKVKGMKFFRTIYYLPAVVSGVAVCMLWRWIFSPDYGLMNMALRVFGIRGPLWLQSPVWSKPALIIMSLWGVGGTMVIYLGGLQGIPGELYEAASIDGAGSWKKFTRVTLPMLTPTIFYMLIMNIIGSFQVFTQVYVMTWAGGQLGGPLDSTNFFALYLFRNAFEWFKMGYASAMAWILLLITLIVTLVQFKLAGRWVYYEGEEPKR